MLESSRQLVQLHAGIYGNLPKVPGHVCRVRHFDFRARWALTGGRTLIMYPGPSACRARRCLDIVGRATVQPVVGRMGTVDIESSGWSSRND